MTSLLTKSILLRNEKKTLTWKALSFLSSNYRYLYQTWIQFSVSPVTWMVFIVRSYLYLVERRGGFSLSVRVLSARFLTQPAWNLTWGEESGWGATIIIVCHGTAIETCLCVYMKAIIRRIVDEWQPGGKIGARAIIKGEMWLFWWAVTEFVWNAHIKDENPKKVPTCL